jgi:hypothetical protein
VTKTIYQSSERPLPLKTRYAAHWCVQPTLAMHSRTLTPKRLSSGFLRDLLVSWGILLRWPGRRRRGDDGGAWGVPTS